LPLPFAPTVYANQLRSPFAPTVNQLRQPVTPTICEPFSPTNLNKRDTKPMKSRGKGGKGKMAVIR
jgi:hypothetical protein